VRLISVKLSLFPGSFLTAMRSPNPPPTIAIFGKDSV